MQYAIKKSEYVYSPTNELLQLTEKLSDAAGVVLLEKTTSYLYDANGNEIRQKISYLQPHEAAMRQVTGGNVTGDTVQDAIQPLLEKVTSKYDGFNRLILMEKIKVGTRATVEFVYNGDGLRTKSSQLRGRIHRAGDELPL